MRRRASSEPRTAITQSTTVRVRFDECDPLGIVWHGNYIRYFEDGREAFGREHGISYLSQQEQGYASPIVSMLCEHQRSLKYGDVATIQVWFCDSPAAKMIFEYEIRDPQGRVACTGRSVQVFVFLGGELALTAPDKFMEWKRKMGLLNG